MVVFLFSVNHWCQSIPVNIVDLIRILCVYCDIEHSLDCLGVFGNRNTWSGRFPLSPSCNRPPNRHRAVDGPVVCRCPASHVKLVASPVLQVNLPSPEPVPVFNERIPRYCDHRRPFPKFPVRPQAGSQALIVQMPPRGLQQYLNILAWEVCRLRASCNPRIPSYCGRWVRCCTNKRPYFF